MNWGLIFWLLGAFVAGGTIGFMICAIFTCGAISDARFNEQCAKDYIKILEAQKEQN